MTYEDNRTKRSGWRYRYYEKQAGWTLKRLRLHGGITLFWMAAATKCIMGLIGYSSLSGFIADIISGVLMGLVFGGVFMFAMNYMARHSQAYKTEITEGYSDKLIEQLRSYEKVTPVTASSVSLAYNFRGEFNESLAELRRVNAYSLYVNPNGAHNYFAALLQACLLAGDTEAARAAYENGFYYLKTYMNSPISGANVSLSLAIYEYFNSRFDLSLNLLDNAFKLLNKDYDPEQHIPDENLRSILSYWRAKNLIAVGNKGEALKMLSNCKNYYKTDYYKKKIDELKKELENETVS